MKILFDHKNGIYTSDGSCLLAVEAIKENETCQYMFENGWLPYQNQWYQCKSSRLKLSEISSRRKKELSKINFCEDIDCNIEDIIQRAKKYNKFNEEWLRYFLNLPHYKVVMDDAAFSIVNFFEDQIFYTTLVWDKDKSKNSYGTLSYYYLIEKFRHTHKYLYISEYYEMFSYKDTLQGFEFWDGNNWQNSRV